MKRAWRTTLYGLVSIVAAETRAQARYRTIRSAHDAGYRTARIIDVRAVRAPEHDAWASVDATGAPWNEIYLPSVEV